MPSCKPNRAARRRIAGALWLAHAGSAALLLSACVGGVILGVKPTATPPPTSAPTLTPTPAPSLVLSGAEGTAEGATPTPQPTIAPTAPARPTERSLASPTPAQPTATAESALRLALVASEAREDDSSAAALAHAAAAQAAAIGGFTYERIQTDDVAEAIGALADEGFDVVVVVGAEHSRDTRLAARRHPDLVVIGLDQTGRPPLPENYVLLGGDGTRHDQLGFVAGASAGLATESGIVGALTPAGGLAGRKYLGGFIHGVRLTCGHCEYWTVEEDSYDQAAAGREAVQRLQRARVDVVFAAPGAAGDAALATAAAAGLWVVGAESDVFVSLFGAADVTGSDRVLPSPILRADVMLAAVLETLLSGVFPESPLPFSYGNGTMGLEVTSAGGLSPAEVSIVEGVVERLTSGQLGTGIDPLTGEEV